jgi:hypothetical protein
VGWNEEEVSWTEWGLERVVLFMKLLTSWFVMPIWIFAITFAGGQHLLYCITISVVFGIFAYYVWREVPAEKIDSGEEE